MKKLTTLALLCVCIMILAGCTSNKPSENNTNISPVEVAQKIIEACGRDSESLFAIHEAFETEDLIDFAANKYGVDIATEDDIGAYEADETIAFEIAVFRFTNNEDAAAAAEKLKEYILSVEKSYEGYMPELEYIAHNSISASYGCYSALLICEDTATAQEAFENAINS